MSESDDDFEFEAMRQHLKNSPRPKSFGEWLNIITEGIRGVLGMTFVLAVVASMFLAAVGGIADGLSCSSNSSYGEYRQR